METLADYYRDHPKRARKTAVRAARAAAFMAQREAVLQIGRVKPFAPIDTGTMRRSYKVDIKPDGADLRNTAPYAPFQEFGTKPFKAPLKPLLAWAKRKKRGASKGSVWALAKGAQKSIAKRGIKPKRFHRTASQKFGAIHRIALLGEMRKEFG